MSILIKGMDMPTDCASCDLSYYCDGYAGGYGYDPSGWRCRRLNRLIKKDENNYYPRPSDCPLSEIPTPHGRLIDADRLLEAFSEALKEDSYWVNFFAIVENAPTVIEAEGKS